MKPDVVDTQNDSHELKMVAFHQCLFSQEHALVRAPIRALVTVASTTA